MLDVLVVVFIRSNARICRACAHSDVVDHDHLHVHNHYQSAARTTNRSIYLLVLILARLLLEEERDTRFQQFLGATARVWAYKNVLIQQLDHGDVFFALRYLRLYHTYMNTAEALFAQGECAANTSTGSPGSLLKTRLRVSQPLNLLRDVANPPPLSHTHT